MQILAWHPAKPPKVTARTVRSVDRLITLYTRISGSRPRTCVIHLDEQLRDVASIEFNPGYGGRIRR